MILLIIHPHFLTLTASVILEILLCKILLSFHDRELLITIFYCLDTYYANISYSLTLATAESLMFSLVFSLLSTTGNVLPALKQNRSPWSAQIHELCSGQSHGCEDH